MKSEVLTLTLSQVDLSAGTLRNLLKEAGRVIPYLFPHLTAGHFQGERICDFRKSWAIACKATGLSGMLRHDFRRTVTRNLIRSGVPEVVSMRITGHRMRSVFDRYNIVSPADLQDAARKMADGHILGHSAFSPLDSVTVSR